MAVHRGRGKSVDVDRDGLAGAHIGQLRLFVIGNNVDGLQRYDCHQLRAGVDIFADPQGADPHGAVDRRPDHGVAEVQLGLLLDRLLLGERGLGLGELCLEDADLSLGNTDTLGIALQCGSLFTRGGVRLLRHLHGAIGALRQLVVALELLLRVDERRLIRVSDLTGLCDREPLLGDLLVQGIDAGLCRRDVGTCLVERGLIIPRVDPREDLAGADRLIVVDRYLRDIARHPGADQDRMRLHISVVGRHQKAAGGPVIITVERCRREKHQPRRRAQQSLQRPSARLGIRRSLVGGLGIADGLRSVIKRHRHQALCFAQSSDGGFATRLHTTVASADGCSEGGNGRDM